MDKVITCKCGCREKLIGVDNRNRPRKYIYGHNLRKIDNPYKFKSGHNTWNKNKKGIHLSSKSEIKKGQRLSPETEFKKGQVAWNKGLKGIKLNRKNFKMNLESRIKISMAKRKVKSNIFDGFLTAIDKKQRIEFRSKIQKLVFERDNYTCQMCSIKGGYLQVDHIQSWAEYVELRFSLENCRTLCMDCHYFVTYGKKKPKNIVWGHNLKRKAGEII